jgi:hypothetical protein
MSEITVQISSEITGQVSPVEIDLSNAVGLSAEEIDDLFERLQYYSSAGSISLCITEKIPRHLKKFSWLDRLVVISEYVCDIDCADFPRSISHLDLGCDCIRKVTNLRLLPNLVSIALNKQQLADIEPLLSVEHSLLQCIVIRDANKKDDAVIKRFTFDLQERIARGLLFLGFSHLGNFA